MVIRSIRLHVKENILISIRDGRWFEMHTSSRKGLDGHRKMGVCIGSLPCENNTCPKLLTEGVCNTNEFFKG